MCQILSSVLVGLGLWAEDCPCHDKRMRAPDKTSHKASEVERRFKKFLNKPGMSEGDAARMWNQCPFRGKRAIELACGVLTHLLEHSCFICARFLVSVLLSRVITY